MLYNKGGQGGKARRRIDLEERHGKEMQRESDQIPIGVGMRELEEIMKGLRGKGDVRSEREIEETTER